MPLIDTVRLPTARLDALLRQAEDLLGPKLAAVERVRDAQTLVEALQGSKGLEAQARELLQHLVRDQRSLTTVVEGLQEAMRRLRMMPASSVLDLFPPMVQDLAGAQGKEVEWEAWGTELEVDRKVLEAVKDPVIHLVRNAIDHGIEPPAARLQADKARRGRVAVTIAPVEGNRIEISVTDDGRGIDLAQVRAAAVRSRLLSPEQAQALTDEEALDLIYRSGLSTTPIITGVSGHGLGLAIVQERVERLGGSLQVETRAGAGTTVRMLLPASIATFHGLLIRGGGQPFLLPIEAVERVMRLATETIERIEGRDVVRWNGHPLPLTRLSRLLGLPEPANTPEGSGGKQPCVVMRVGEEQAGLLVEAILGDQEGLVKEFGPPLVRVRNVSGAVLLGSGQVVLVLRPVDLLKSIREAPRPPVPAAVPAAKGRPPVILVVLDTAQERGVRSCSVGRGHAPHGWL
jgi:two-component system chemotaxis sensor kinase CheA